MFWDRVAGVYDVFVNVINRRTHQKLKRIVTDLVEPWWVFKASAEEMAKDYHVYLFIADGHDGLGTEFVSLENEAELHTWSDRFASVTAKSYMHGYRDLPNAEITCLDYSENMMASAQEKARALGLTNISFRQGDVGALPFEDESFDIVLSLNGFHAFPDKEGAYRETYRVLKPGGTFCGCFYVQGGHNRTDWFITHLYQPKGFFTLPYETEQSLRTRFSGIYRQAEVTMVEGIGCFCCRK